MNKFKNGDLVEIYVYPLAGWRHGVYCEYIDAQKIHKIIIQGNPCLYHSSESYITNFGYTEKFGTIDPAVKEIVMMSKIGNRQDKTLGMARYDGTSYTISRPYGLDNELSDNLNNRSFWSAKEMGTNITIYTRVPEIMLEVN